MGDKMTGTSAPWLLAACAILAATSHTGFAATGQTAKEVIIVRAEAHSWQDASPDNFTGAVRLERFNTAERLKGGSSLSIGRVHFPPGARTGWHTHPAGQTFIVEEGEGWTQTADRRKETMRAGDVVWCPAGVKHWHGATATSAMTHIAIAPIQDGKSAVWYEKVRDEEYDAANPHEMPPRFQKIALIAAFTASGDMDRLERALVGALEAGLTVNEIKEVLIHTYAYAGFPRALNGINAFIAVMDAREKQGIKDVHGPEARPRAMSKSKYQYGHDVLASLRNPAHPAAASTAVPKPRYETFAPTIEVFLKEHLFADIFIRDVLDYRSREIATVGVLGNLPGANAQFRSHTGLAMTQGFTEAQMRHLFTLLGDSLGKERGDNALGVLDEVMRSRKK
jgi:quercetin dioxygenase-like cupin family protein